MFLNDTLLVLTYTANMMATFDKMDNGTSIEGDLDIYNATTTLSPEEKENKFDFDDRKSMSMIYHSRRFIINECQFRYLRTYVVKFNGLSAYALNVYLCKTVDSFFISSSKTPRRRCFVCDY